MSSQRQSHAGKSGWQKEQYIKSLRGSSYEPTQEELSPLLDTDRLTDKVETPILRSAKPRPRTIATKISMFWQKLATIG